MKLFVIIVLRLLCIFILGNSLYAQNLPVQIKDSLPDIARSNKNNPLDSVDSLVNNDSLNLIKAIPVAPDAIKEKITYTVPDSIIIDVHKNITQFYGVNVQIETEDMKLVSPKVIFYQDSDLLVAYSLPDTIMEDDNRPSFSQKEEIFYFDEIKYNFESQRAIVLNARSQYNDGFIISEKIKRNSDQTIFGYHNQYTTCSLPHPHYSIESNKIKIIPNKVVVAGTSRLELAEIPTPLILPFAMFPITSGQRNGFILPTYDFSPNNGIGLRGLGYYVAINEYMDFKISGNIYSYGTWQMSGQTTYSKKYKYSGLFGISFGSLTNGNKLNENYTESRSFGINWNHTVNPKYLRGYNFSAGVNYMTANNFRNNSYNSNQFLQNSTNSNISLTKSFKNTPFNLSMNVRHSQNNSTRQVNLTLPSIQLNMIQQFPFRRKIQSGAERWYEKIGIGYNFSAVNSVAFVDSLLRLTNPNTYNMRNGFTNKIQIQASYKILKYLNFNNSIEYSDYYNTRKSTIAYSSVNNTFDTLITKGLFASREYKFSTGFNTTIYGLFKFKNGRISAIRHQMIPALGFSYTPNFADPKFGTYYYMPNDTVEQGRLLPYFDNTVGFAGLGNTGNIVFQLNNNVQMKLRSKKDSSGFIKSPLIDALNFSTSYNLISDSFKLAPLIINYRLTILKQISVVGNINFSPYSINKINGRLMDVYRWNNNEGFLRFTNFVFNVSGGVNSTMFGSDKNKKNATPMVYNDFFDNYVDFDIPWSINITINNSINQAFSKSSHKDTIIYNLNTSIRGDFSLSPRWKFDYNLNYDFVNKKLNYTEFNLYRDLHCWEMKIGTIPFGFHKSYNFTLNVKSALLQDLRINKRSDYIDNF